MNPLLGTILKLAVTASVVGANVHLSDEQVDFSCTFWAKNGLKRRLTLTKSAEPDDPHMIEESADCYIAVIDTSILGRGEYWMDMEVTIPDSDVDTGVRVERVRVYTGVRVS